MSRKTIHCDVLVIGSGPGGAITAMLLAKAGRDVVLLEEGQSFPPGQCPSYSLEEMNSKYRHGGLSLSLGKEKVAYLEGCCVGGASEINAGLYHRPLPETLDGWRDRFKLKSFSHSIMEPYFQENERTFKVSKMIGPLPPASALIEKGAQALGWSCDQIPRLWDNASGVKQTMSEVVIPEFVKAGGRLFTGTKALRIYGNGHKGIEAVTRLMKVKFNHLFLCAGAVQTPFLLRRSGIKKNIGNTLRMHPAVRVVAAFDQEVHDPKEGVPVCQVNEFKPEITLGGSYSGLPHLALWLAGRKDFHEHLKAWRKRAIFYALTKASTPGKVRALAFINQPWVSLPVTQADKVLMEQALGYLQELLKAAGAVDVIRSPRLDFSTVHLFCSCPMGEDVSSAAVDSFGRLHGYENIIINDASILPDSPGVNPQAVIMALARRNTERFLKVA